MMAGMLQLSPHFSLEELTHTDTGLPNQPNPAEVGLLRTLATFLEKIRSRALKDQAMAIDSAFRSDAVNRKVGGVPTSAHRLCFAADFTAPTFGEPLACAQAIDAAAQRGEVAFDQLIYEQNENGPELDWVHVSRDPRLRGQRLTRLPDGSYIGGLVGRK